MDRSEKAEALIEQAERCGLRVAYDSGFLTITGAASSDQRRDDTAETEQAIVEQLGKSARSVFDVAVAKARGARGRAFVGQQVYIPATQIEGTLADCSAKGIVTAEYRVTINPERISNSNCSCSGDDLLVILDGERSDGDSPTFFSWVPDEKVRRVLEHLASAGVSLEHDCGFIVAKWRGIGDVEGAAREALLRQLGRSWREVFVQLVGHARGVRGADFVGNRVFIQEFDAFGILASCEVDGSLTVSYRDKSLKSDLTVQHKGDGLIVLAGAGEAVESSSADQNSEGTWRRLVRRAFRG